MLTPPSPESARQLGPISVRAADASQAMRDIAGAVFHRQPLRVAFANTHLMYYAVRDPAYARAMSAFYIVNDGVGIDLLARLACGRGFEENLNGTDFTPRVLAVLPFGARVMLVGARPSVVQRAAHQLARRWPQLDICAQYDGYSGVDHALSDIDEIAPDVVLVAMGNPLQEEWIARAAEIHPSAVYLGVGALFDFLTDTAPRAPEPLRRFKLEWAFRLALEPRRMWRRYTVEVLVVAAALLRPRVH